VAQCQSREAVGKQHKSPLFAARHPCSGFPDTSALCTARAELQASHTSTTRALQAGLTAAPREGSGKKTTFAGIGMPGCEQLWHRINSH